MTNSYFPNGKDNQSHWYANMAANFPSVSVTLGFSPQDTDDWMVTASLPPSCSGR